ncbi:orotidine 5'-phosphate decarboxylase [Bacillus infantis]|uniref:3-hexulose-6-phosphate synthase n=1 Tax=Bacillus infantis TaxID=324767 RepID=UPI000B9AE291|nr:3-hexulose-6-phosphate synthase [Bacillus infantis]MCK6208775.1 orotidine 5'-phosphate decarboxylase [Bacillus infantis]OXT16637.1 Fe-S cluster assembly protein HesB [Bacillus sp. OG2]
MYLQLALDRLTREECLKILEETADSIDWIEIGTGVIKEYGMQIIREMKGLYPDKMIVADMKTCDAGKHEALQAFNAGADITTVMAFSANQTILDTLEVAGLHGKRIMIDLLGVKSKERVNELYELGADLVSLHYGKDMQKSSSFKEDAFLLTEDCPGLSVSVAGGITLDTLDTVMKKQPDILIIGSGITGAENPGEAAAKIKEKMS